MRKILFVQKKSGKFSLRRKKSGKFCVRRKSRKSAIGARTIYLITLHYQCQADK